MHVGVGRRQCGRELLRAQHADQEVPCVADDADGVWKPACVLHHLQHFVP